jgi:hypothetical protein
MELRPVVRLDLGLAVTVIWVCRRLAFARTLLGLTRPYIRLAGTGRVYLLYLWPIVWFAGPISGLDVRLGLVRSVCRIGARECRLTGGDRPRGGDHGRAPTVHVVELLAVLLRFALMLDLGGHGRDSGCAHGFNFGWAWSCGDAASASVVGDASVVVDDDGAVVDVGDVRADVVDGAVVVEVVAAPIAAVIADAGIAEAIVDATVEADVVAPIAAMEAPASVVPAPVAGGPKGAVERWSAPGTGDPVVAGGRPVPVAGGPDVVWRGGLRLLVDGQRRRRLVGVFDGRGFAFFVELVGGLRILIGLILICLILIGWWGSGLLRVLLGRILLGILLLRILLGRILLGILLLRVLLVTLLGLGLRANSEDCGFWSRS